jgi:hypothetical protein
MPKTKVKLTAEVPRKKNPPSTAFKTGNPFRFPAGVSGNPAGCKPKNEMRLVGKALHAQLPTRAPDVVAKALGLDPGASWAQCIGASLLRHAVKGDMGAARLVIEVTEGTKSKLELVDESGGSVTGALFNVVFVEADGQGRPLHASTIDALPSMQRQLSSTASDDSDD